MKTIAVLLTCFNRKKQTVSCLKTLYSVYEKYTLEHTESEKFSLAVYLTDDGCTDGTADAIQKEFRNRNIKILQGSGSLYWAGGMRFAWKAALNDDTNWDYYLLLNDDTDLLPNLFDELFATCDYSLRKFGKEGIISGSTSAKSDHSIITYGGEVWTNKWTARSRLVVAHGLPESVDIANANIMLVKSSVVKEIGIFYKGFQHGVADYDYSNHARKAGFPVLLTGNICGRCENDHDSFDELKNKVMAMTLQERIRFFSNPLHSISDYLCYIRRNAIIRYPMVFLGRLMNEFFPQIYYKLYSMR